MYPEEIKQRAMELNREHSTAQVHRQLAREYPDDQVPDESTIKRWVDEAGAEALEKRRQLFIEERRQAHFSHMTDIANMLLAKEVGSVMNAEGDSYTIVEKYSAIDKTREELSAMIESNIDSICSILTTWEFFDCFVKHLEYENEELKRDFYKYINSKPLELIKLVRTLAQTREFKGKCPVCEDW